MGNPLWVALAVAVVGFNAWVASVLGADFWVVFSSLGKSIFVFAVAGFLVYSGQFRLTRTFFFLLLAALFPWWWPVMDSVAINSSVPRRLGFESGFDVDLPWWCAWWFKGLIELALLGVAAYFWGDDRW